MRKFPLFSLEETQKIAKEFAEKATLGDIFLLFGDLGSGKTTFSRFFIQSFFGDHTLNVTSPTFPIIQTYGPHNEIWHIDLYRIDDESEIYNLGLEEAQNKSIMIIEWPEKLGNYRPHGNIIHLNFSIIDSTRILIQV